MTEATNLGPKLKDIGCRRPEDCSDVDGTYCDADLGFCLCKPDYPVTDTNHCYKGRTIQCPLDLRKIFGVAKKFLKSRSFLFQTQQNP